MSFPQQLQDALRQVEEALAEALFAVVDGTVKPRALALIPRDTNTAADSVQVSAPQPTIDGFAVKIGFGSDSDVNPKTGQNSNSYIVPLHERLDLSHPNGGQAKFLEQAVTESAPAFGAAMQASMRKGP